MTEDRFDSDRDQSSMPGWGHFRIEVPDRNVRAYDRGSWRRMAEFMERRFRETGCEIWGHQRLDQDCWVYEGHAPSDVATVLQAAARGDDLDAVLDLFEQTATAQSDEPKGA